MPIQEGLDYPCTRGSGSWRGNERVASRAKQIVSKDKPVRHQELVRKAEVVRSSLIKPEFHSRGKGTERQIDSGWTGQVLSVSI